VSHIKGEDMEEPPSFGAKLDTYGFHRWHDQDWKKRKDSSRHKSCSDKQRALYSQKGSLKKVWEQWQIVDNQ